MNADGSNQTRINANLAKDYSASWSPDGTKMAFTSERPANHQEMYTMNSDGTGVLQLTSHCCGIGQPDWSPDGNKIVFNKQEYGWEIYVMNADGSGQTTLTDNRHSNWTPSWSPDGSRIAFTSDRDGNTYIYLMNADGTGQTRLTNNVGGDLEPSWGPGGSLTVSALPTPTSIGRVESLDYLNNSLYYLSSVTQQEAQRLLDYLVHEEFIDSETEVTIQLRKEGGVYEVRFPFMEGIDLNDPDISGMSKQAACDLESDVFTDSVVHWVAVGDSFDDVLKRYMCW